ncbi:MAG: sulfotransferase family protein [Acidimicrobiales bacterium]
MSNPEDHTLVFVGGLHRSGTTLLARLLASSPDVSGFAGTGAPSDEGQYLQDVYPTANVYGGPGRFGYQPDMHQTEGSVLATRASRDVLWAQWSRHWDLSRPVLVEKSPPDLLKARLLQALFPEARFVFVVRHPLPTAIATQRWCHRSLLRLVDHWAHCHLLMQGDLPHLRRRLVVRYEDLTSDPCSTLLAVRSFVGLGDGVGAALAGGGDSGGGDSGAGGSGGADGERPVIRGDLNEEYFSRWRSCRWDVRRRGALTCRLERVVLPVILGPRVRRLGLGYSLLAPFVTSWANGAR